MSEEQEPKCELAAAEARLRDAWVEVVAATAARNEARRAARARDLADRRARD